MNIKALTGVFPLLLLAFGGAHAAAPSREAVANYGKLPLSFEPNRGQTDARVQFVARGAGYTIFLSPTSATFALRHNATGPESAVIRMDLVGANPTLAIEPQDKLPGISNYLMGSTDAKWPINLPNYAKTRARNVYPGIDLVYYGTRGQLEYDFVLAPGADPSRIRLKFAGATPVVDASGDLVLPMNAQDRASDIRFHKPVLYQEAGGIRQPVNGRFVLAAHSHEVRFEVGSYDHSRELVIDPVLVYSSYLGGTSQTSTISAMAVNGRNIYVTGTTHAVNYPTTTGVVAPACPANDPASYNALAKCGASSQGTAFVSEISADGGSLLYSTYLGGGGGGTGVGGSAVGTGGSGGEQGTGIAVDGSGNAWVVGLTNSNNFPVTTDAYSLYCEPVAQAFNFNTRAYQGEVNGCAGFNSGGEYIYSGTFSLFLVKLNPTGTAILYGTFLGGSEGELGAQIALDGAGNIYLAGTAQTTSSNVFATSGQYTFPTTSNAFQTQSPNPNINFSAFAMKLTPDGKSLVYSSLLSGPNNSTFNGALAISQGKMFIGGGTRDPHLPTTAGALSSTCPSTNQTQCVTNLVNGYVAEFDPTKSGTASLVFSTYLNGSVAASPGAVTSSVSALAADAQGNVYAAGTNAYKDFPTTAGALQTTCALHSGVCGTGFVTKLSATGALVWSTFYGSQTGDVASGNENVAAIALDSSNNVYITGPASDGGPYPLTNGFQGFAAGAAYVTELNSTGSQVLFGSFYGGAALVTPVALAVDGAENIYLTGNTTANLPLVNALQSTAAGGFAEGFFAKIAVFTPQTITFGAIAGRAPGGPPFNISASASSGLAVTFTSNSLPVCTVSGATVTIVSVGTCSITASQAGNATYAAAPSVTQTFAIAVPCTFSLTTSSAMVPAAGGVGFSVVLTASGSGCAWTALSNASWLTVTSASSGTGSTTVNYSVAANHNAGSLAGAITIGGQTLTVTSEGAVIALQFYPITPCRLVDTRAGEGKSGAFGPPALAASSSRDFPLLSAGCGIPLSGVQAYSLNFTAIPSGPLGFLSVWPAGSAYPGVSTLNASDGSIIANAAIVPAGTAGSITVVAGNPTNLVIDINGYFAPASASGLDFFPLTPCRIADTRAGEGKTGAFGPPRLAASSTRDFPIATSPCLPGTPQAYSLNITAVPQGPLGFLSTWPAGLAYPGVSTLNSSDGTVLANAALVPAGTNGDINVVAGNPTDLIIDINGTFSAPAVGGLQFYAVTPCRVADTRPGEGFTGAFGSPGLAASTTRNFPIQSSQCGIPATAQAYALNMTVVPPGPLGFLSTWPTGQAYPGVSTLNSSNGNIIANAAIVPAGTGGAISVVAGNPTDLIIDIVGYFAP